jgi:vancomycin resistance protein VanJ
VARGAPASRRPGRVPDRLHRVPLVYAAGTLVALLAWGLAGDTWWVQPLSLTTFWWTLPGVALAALAALARRPRAAVLFAVPALVWAWTYGGLFLPGRSATTAPDLRVVSYNTYVHSPSPASLGALVEATDPDVLLLQEVFPERETRLAATYAARYPHQLAVQSPGVGGVMVLSRFPIAETRPVALSSPGTRDTAVVVLDVDGRPVQVVPVHLTSPCPRCGASLTERLDLEGDRRPAELASVLRALTPGVPAVIGGDFNSTERSEPYRLLTRVGFEDPQRAAGHGPGFTWPNDELPFPVLRIDWILTRGLVAVDAWVGDGGSSDHRPVVTDLALPEPT